MPKYNDEFDELSAEARGAIEHALAALDLSGHVDPEINRERLIEAVCSATVEREPLTSASFMDTVRQLLAESGRDPQHVRRFIRKYAV